MTWFVPGPHRPRRPTWDCEVCELEWPCPRGRSDLRSGRNRVQLAILMWVLVEDVAHDLPDMPALEMYDRFMNWARATR